MYIPGRRGTIVTAWVMVLVVVLLGAALGLTLAGSEGNVAAVLMLLGLAGVFVALAVALFRQAKGEQK